MKCGILFLDQDESFIGIGENYHQAYADAKKNFGLDICFFTVRDYTEEIPEEDDGELAVVTITDYLYNQLREQSYSVDFSDNGEFFFSLEEV